MKALIVEDEFLSRKVLRSFLANNFEVDIVVNGQEALAAFEAAHDEDDPYDLILMDIMMPEIDGMEALERIRDMERERGYSNCKIIMTTALDDPNTVIRSFHDGEASAYMVKPVDKGKLYSELVKLGLDVV